MNGPVSNLLTEWQQASDDLGLDIVAPFVVHLPSGAQIEALFLLRHFGAREGMLIVTDFAVLSHHLEALARAGYGYSVLSEPRSAENYVRDDFLEVLRDWGWSGPPELKPDWL